MYTSLVNILRLIILSDCFYTELSIGITGNVSLSKPLLSNQVYTLCKYRRRGLQPPYFRDIKKQALSLPANLTTKSDNSINVGYQSPVQQHFHCLPVEQKESLVIRCRGFLSIIFQVSIYSVVS